MSGKPDYYAMGARPGWEDVVDALVDAEEGLEEACARCGDRREGWPCGTCPAGYLGPAEEVRACGAPERPRADPVPFDAERWGRKPAGWTKRIEDALGLRSKNPRKKDEEFPILSPRGMARRREREDNLGQDDRRLGADGRIHDL